MRNQRLEMAVKRITSYLEAVVAVIIIAAIVFGMVDLIKYIGLIFMTNPIDTYDVFQKFLGHALLLVVGAELVLMLVLNTPAFIMEVLLFAIARKLLIGSQGMMEYILGIISIALIFAIKKYLVPPKTDYNKEISSNSNN